jgi:hypothetical protein
MIDMETASRLIRRAIFPIAGVAAVVLAGAIVSVRLAADGERAAPIVALVSRAPEPAVDDSRGVTSGAFVSTADGGLDERGAPIVATGEPAVAAVAVDFPRADTEADRLRAQILRVARDFPGSSRSEVLVRRLAAISPAEALACVAELPSDEVRDRSVAAIAQDWVERDATGAVAAVAGFRDSAVGREFHLRVVEQLARTRPSRALSLVKSLSAREESLELLAEVFREWARTDPRMATARLFELERGAERSELLADVLATWARQDMSNAVRAVIVVTENDGRSRALRGVVRRLAEGSNTKDGLQLSAAFVRAVMLRAGMGMEEQERLGVAVAALDELGAIDPDSLARFFDAIPPGYDRAVLTKRLVADASEKSPERAAVYALRFASGTERIAAIRRASSGLVRDNERAALAWIDTMSSAEDRAAAIQAVLFEISDLALAQEWLRGRMGQADADVAIQAFVLRSAREDAPLAASWARQIGDATLRYFAIEAVARAWLQVNRPALEAWLARTDLPEARVNRLLAR